MHGIYVAALLVSLLALLVACWIGLRPHANRRLLAVTILFLLPANYVALHYVRVPIDGLITSVFGAGSALHLLASVLYAPVTEELAKLAPVLAAFLISRAAIFEQVPLHRLALVIGFAFGAGEAWTVAGLIRQVPEVADLPWYMLSGYMSERLMVCIAHSGFTASALYFIFNRRRVVAGLLVAMAIHFSFNFPIFMAQFNLFGLGETAWAALVQSWLIIGTLLMIWLLLRLRFGSEWRDGVCQSQCLKCGSIYARNWLMGINLGNKRFERCACCKEWGLVDAILKEGALHDSKAEGSRP